MNEVTKVDEAESLPVVASPEAQIMQAISAIATNPDADIEKMERLMAMHEKMEDRQAEREFNAALAAAQAEIGPVTVNKENTHSKSKYANLEAIANRVRPILTTHGFSTTFRELPDPKQGHVKVEGVLRHRDGWKETYENEVPLDGVGAKGNANKTATHAHGSSLTYARRYCLMGMLDISITEDDDGNTGGGAQAPAKISDEQAAEIEHLAEAEGVDLGGFLKYHNLTDIADLEAKNFGAACAQIRKAGIARRANGAPDE